MHRGRQHKWPTSSAWCAGMEDSTWQTHRLLSVEAIRPTQPTCVLGKIRRNKKGCLKYSNGRRAVVQRGPFSLSQPIPRAVGELELFYISSEWESGDGPIR
eukprot:GHVS01063726.1.p1 GENE.GHVS01063726.1~~GHVS01063726.1.p1  ORF type:complete len:101 (-),score=6.82 GHVS01063726.1:171-473(-)